MDCLKNEYLDRCSTGMKSFKGVVDFVKASTTTFSVVRTTSKKKQPWFWIRLADSMERLREQLVGPTLVTEELDDAQTAQRVRSLVRSNVVVDHNALSKMYENVYGCELGVRFIASVL